MVARSFYRCKREPKNTKLEEWGSDNSNSSVQSVSKSLNVMDHEDLLVLSFQQEKNSPGSMSRRIIEVLS